MQWNQYEVGWTGGWKGANPKKMRRVDASYMIHLAKNTKRWALYTGSLSKGKSRSKKH